ncbi:MAG: hypothetical protein M0Z41_20665 [Peptococcaceae bacterium]|jgi:hypothetical protein|nr:hypothetical protein [Peptococcaceae bacterium]
MPEGKGQKYIRLAVILMPAAIFLAFYLNGVFHRAEPGPPVRPPALTVNAGDTVNLGGDSFRAGYPAPLFTRTISEPDNTIMAGPDQTFVIVPAIILRHNLPARPTGLTWQLVDDAGAAHPLISPRHLLVPPAVTVSPRLDPVYLVFSLPDGSNTPFLLLTTPAGQAAWRLNRR